MSSVMTPDSRVSARTASRPADTGPITPAQARRLRQELMRRLRRGGNGLFSPLTEAEVAAVMECSPRTVRYGVAEAEALRTAVREVTEHELN